MNATNANRSGASKAMNDAFDFQAWFAAVQQQTQTQVSRLEIVQTLSKMNGFQCLDGFELHKQHVFH
jgi:hypothetical protein